MLGNKGNKLDELVRSNLNQLDVKAPAGAWENIAPHIPKKKRGAFLIYWPYAASIAVILGLFFVWPNTSERYAENAAAEKVIGSETSDSASVHSNSSDQVEMETPDPTAGNQSQEDINKQIEVHHSQSKITLKKSGSAIQKNQHSKSLQKEIKSSKSKIKTSLTSQSKEYLALNAEPIAESDENTHLALNHLIVESVKEELLLASNKDATFKKSMIPHVEFLEDEREEAKILVSGMASPMYSFRNTNQTELEQAWGWGGGSENEANEQGLLAYTAGVQIDYEVSRWSFSSGIYYSQQGQQVDNVNINKLLYNNHSSVILAATSIGNVQVAEFDSPVTGALVEDVDNPQDVLFAGDPTATESSIIQQIEFLEIPLIARYKFIDKKLDVQVLGGLSTAFMVDNVVVLNQMDEARDLGQIENLNTINYNSLFGLGFQYPFTDRLRFSVQPMVRYGLRPLNKDYGVDYIPYSFSIYTGMAWEF